MYDELIPEFIEESKSSLANIESDLLRLESDESVNVDCVNRVFRAMHTIKGSGSFLKLKMIVSVSHRAESLLCKIRDGETLPTTENVGVILDAVDAITAMLEAEDLGESQDFNDLLQRLDRVVAIETLISAELEQPTKSTAPSASPPIDLAPQGIDRNEPNAMQKSAHVNQSASNHEPSTSTTSSRISDPTMRVPASVLNHLLQITGGMVMARNQLLNTTDQLDNASLERLSRLISEVHETVIKTRKGSTGALFNRFHRVVRDLALSLGKEATLVIEGGELELDRSIIESFTDPLTHLVRNCMDHALETPQERVANGKSPAGTVWLRSFLQSGEIVIEIEDDGRGIDPSKIRKKAVEKQVITAQQAATLSDEAALDLIFLPGFSTKEQATDVSGRGVGMDVVKTNIEQIGGAITFESKVGEGTKLTAHLPLAKALVASSLTRTLIVGIGGSQFAIPDSAICEIISPDESNYPRDFRALEHGEVFHLRDSILPLIHLADAIGRPRMLYSDRLQTYQEDPSATIGPSQFTKDNRATAIRKQPPNVAIVIIRHRQHRFALVVNEVCGIREVIVQPIPKLLEHSRLFTGHAVLGDGRCICILDIGSIAKRKRLNFDTTTNVPVVLKQASVQAERFLVFNYAEDEYFAIPLEIASLVQSIEPDQIRRLGTSSYYPVQDKMVSLVYLDQCLRVRPLPRDGVPKSIIIPANFEFDIAIACGDDFQVHELQDCFRSKTESDSCSVGIFEVDGKLVTLLDLYRLVELHSPDCVSISAVATKSARILCAEDSVFFKRLLQQYLNQPEWEVTIADHGREAWNLLDRNPDGFDLVISDINMPEMNGFELAEKIRSDSRFDSIPLIALTTQVDEQSRARGLKLGFERYVGKINKFALRQCVEQVLAGSVAKASQLV